ncbi:hypothetical protein ACP4OV_021369 [Aristida adscensionis]
MFLEVEVEEAIMGDQAAPATTTEDQLALEAAEQLIQLSGGGDGESESRSADSVKCCREKDKEAAVESRPRRRRAERAPAAAAEDGGADGCDGGVLDDGEARKRPRFRWLADIYRETKKVKAAAAAEEGERKEKKRAADEVIPVLTGNRQGGQSCRLETVRHTRA